MMKCVVLLSALVAVAFAGSVPVKDGFKTVDQEFVKRQKLILDLLGNVIQTNVNFEHHNVGKTYDIAANIDNYTNKKAVEEFLNIYNTRINPKARIFSVFNDRMREEAIALYHLFYYAKDFDTFYKTAAWAHCWINEGMFVYSFSIAVMQRPDTKGMVIPAPYEIYPYYFLNSDVINKLRRTKMQEGIIQPELAEQYGITYADNVYTVRANYSGWYQYDNEEQKISYFTEDIGLNTYYYYFHTTFPFWMTETEAQFPLKERRGEIYYYYYQQLLARYYMERLTNGLGEIPEFSWKLPIKTGYTPNLVSHTVYPFVTRNNYYHIHTSENTHDIQFLENYEEQFLQMLEQGYFKGDKKEVNFKDWTSINFVGKYWESKLENYKTESKNYQKYYEILARVLLGAAPETTSDYYSAPVVLEQFQTALRDPVFFQLYKRIIYYFLQYKQYLEPYTRENLNFVGVKINDVKVDDLVTYFDFFKFDASNTVERHQKELKDVKSWYNVIQPRLNHKNFNINIEVKSEVATDALFKVFLGPKYDSNGHLINLEDNWMNFIELDYFKYTLTTGKNMIVRNSDEFIFFKNDSMSTFELKQWLDKSKVPVSMSQYFYLLPNRLMLPKGTKDGFPFQFFVMVYPYVSGTEQVKEFSELILDNKPFGYPFDRPVNNYYFYQPNMFFKDVFIHHTGEENVHKLMAPYVHNNYVAKQ